MKKKNNDRIIILGASGQLGSALSTILDRNAYNFGQIYPLNKSELDITNVDDMNKIISEIKPNLIINASAYTKVDKAEDEEEACMNVNYHGVTNLSKICGLNDIPLIHFSTDYVFNGKRPAYHPNSATSPIGVYGKSKLLGEESVKNYASPASIIIRTSWVYSSTGKNFVKTILNIAEKPSGLIPVINDQIGRPTYARSLAEKTSLILSRTCSLGYHTLRIFSGTYHVAGGGKPCSWYDFSREILRQGGSLGFPINTDCTPISSHEWNSKVKRPQNATLDCSRFETQFSTKMDHWKISLTSCLIELKNSY